MISLLYQRLRRNPYKVFLRVAQPDTFPKTVIILGLAIIAHTGAMMHFESMSAMEALWLTMTTITTTGYGDYAAKTVEGRFSTIILMYGLGVLLLMKVIDGFLSMRQRIFHRKLCGQWNWDMDNHIVIIGDVGGATNPTNYLVRLVKQIHAARDWKAHPIQLLTNLYKTGLPPELGDLGVVHYSGTGHEPDALKAVNISEAAAVIVLAESTTDPMADARTFDIVHRVCDIASQNTDIRVIVEMIDDANRDRLKRSCRCELSMLRPMRSYPEMIVRALNAPGSEQIIENLFDSAGDECLRIAVTAKAKWADIVGAVVNAGVGIPIGFEFAGRVVTNPHSSNEIVADALFVIVHESVNDPAGLTKQALSEMKPEWQDKAA